MLSFSEQLRKPNECGYLPIIHSEVEVMSDELKSIKFTKAMLHSSANPPFLLQGRLGKKVSKQILAIHLRLHYQMI